MARRITVRDTSIYDCARAGINISEGTWGGHLIERCDVFDTVLETHDHGSFNSWGRDRYWASNHRGVSEPEVKKDPQLPYLDADGDHRHPRLAAGAATTAGTSTSTTARRTTRSTTT